MADAARLMLLVAVAAALAGRSDGAWCMCRTEQPDSVLQKTLDYACGDGADCKPILQNGACFAPDTVRAHCSYAVNSFYQRNNQNPQACIFSGTTTLVSSDPSGGGCQYPASPSAAVTSTTPTGGNGVYSPPTLGPSALNDNNGAGIGRAIGIVKRVVILACCALMVLFLRA
ncbi:PLASMODESMATA CALLOSE-BINDING PROTEIN 3-like [Phragmites australis]|uniref:PLASMODESMATA CALLOSE-BINDING PROTEIN 3-like n=1 Tax=Phragmites australis TaxID=29695 RepID=UPI002D76DB54|nr:PLASMODESMATA CALLOSE-BINDING PROTEIN 3-like [Phragmites australis]